VTDLPVLYSFRRCPYAIRARLAILSAGLTCNIREVHLANKPNDMIIASPKATIPVMVLPDGTVIEESLEIMSYALGRNDPEGLMLDIDDKAKALVHAYDETFKYHLDRYKYPDRYHEDPAVHRGKALEMLVALDQRLTQNIYLLGQRCSWIDIAIFPFVRQFGAVDEAWFAQQDMIKVQAWLGGFLASIDFERAMVTLPAWKAGDADTLFG
jgi:glutathione S-transferase